MYEFPCDLITDPRSAKHKHARGYSFTLSISEKSVHGIRGRFSKYGNSS